MVNEEPEIYDEVNWKTFFKEAQDCDNHTKLCNFIANFMLKTSTFTKVWNIHCYETEF